MWSLVRESLCLLWRETHTKGLSTRSPTRPEGRGKEGLREDRESQLTKEGRRRQSEERSSRNRSTELGSQEMSQHSKWLCGSFVHIHACKCMESCTKVSQTPPLVLGADPSPCLFFCSFLPPSQLCFVSP